MWEGRRVERHLLRSRIHAGEHCAALARDELPVNEQAGLVGEGGVLHLDALRGGPAGGGRRRQGSLAAFLGACSASCG